MNKSQDALLMRTMMEQLQAGDHVALFYRSRREQLDCVVPYIMIGLERKERCLYIADNNSVAMVMQELAIAGVDIEKEHRRGALSVVTKQETYLRHGVFDPEKMIADLKQEVRSSLQKGFSAFRASGEMTWALDLPSALARLSEYELKLHQELPAEFLVFCQYDETRFSQRVISEMIRIHPKVIARGQLKTHPFCPFQAGDKATTQVQVSVDQVMNLS